MVFEVYTPTLVFEVYTPAQSDNYLLQSGSRVLIQMNTAIAVKKIATAMKLGELVIESSNGSKMISEEGWIRVEVWAPRCSLAWHCIKKCILWPVHDKFWIIYQQVIDLLRERILLNGSILIFAFYLIIIYCYCYLIIELMNYLKCEKSTSDEQTNGPKFDTVGANHMRVDKVVVLARPPHNVGCTTQDFYAGPRGMLEAVESFENGSFWA